MAQIDKTYHHLLQTILSDGFKYEDPNRKGVKRIQIPSYTFKHDFKDGFPAITTKKLYWKGIVGELLWFLRGHTHLKYLTDNKINIWNKDVYNFRVVNDDTGYYKVACKINSFKKYINELPKFPEHEVFDAGRIYGAQWRKWTNMNPSFKDWDPEIDQISNLIEQLRKNPMGTRHIVTAWNPAELDEMALPPCHWSFEILVEPLKEKERINICYNFDILETRKLSLATNSKKRLESYSRKELLDSQNIPKYKFTLKWHQRSVDTFLGLPFNIASYALLAHIIGKLTNMVPKGIIGDLSNVHIYEPHLDAVKKQLSRSTSMFNSKCELENFTGFKPDMHGNFSSWINSREISDFNLTEHNEQSAIKADMLAYS